MGARVRTLRNVSCLVSLVCAVACGGDKSGDRTDDGSGGSGTGGSTANGSMYHVTMYIGGGQMIEAPRPGVSVRIVSVRYGDLVPYAARPTG